MLAGAGVENGDRSDYTPIIVIVGSVTGFVGVLVLFVAVVAIHSYYQQRKLLRVQYKLYTTQVGLHIFAAKGGVEGRHQNRQPPFSGKNVRTDSDVFPPVWNLGAVGLIPLFYISCLVLLPSPVALSVLSFF